MQGLLREAWAWPAASVVQILIDASEQGLVLEAWAGLVASVVQTLAQALVPGLLLEAWAWPVASVVHPLIQAAEQELVLEAGAGPVASVIQILTQTLVQGLLLEAEALEKALVVPLPSGRSIGFLSTETRVKASAIFEVLLPAAQGPQARPESPDKRKHLCASVTFALCSVQGGFSVTGFCQEATGLH